MITTLKPCVHFTDGYLLNPTNALVIHVIGAGGTGSHILTGLARMNHALLATGHPGFQVVIFDNKKVTEANMGRQLFSPAEIGHYKAAALIARVNRFFGTRWKAMTQRYSASLLDSDFDDSAFNVAISCVDTVTARLEIADIFSQLQGQAAAARYRPYYWLDLGNSRYTGQAILGTIEDILQPASGAYTPVGSLPTIATEYGAQLASAEQEDDTPSCSLAEALFHQDLFINAAIADQALSLLWTLLREGFTAYRGFFLNLKEHRSQGIPILEPPLAAAA